MPDPISQDHESYSEQGPIVNGVDSTNAVVAADDIPQASTSLSPDQIIAQALALATTDATALLRRVETTMSDVQSAALTRWIEAGSGEDDPRYQTIVRAAGQVLADAVALWRDINVAAQQLLQTLSEEGERPGSTVEATPAERPSPTLGKKKAAKKKSAAKPKKAAAAKKPASKKAAKKPAKKAAKKAAQKASPKAAKKKPVAKKAAKKSAAPKPAKKQPAVKPVPAPVIEPVADEPMPEAAASNE